MIRKKIKWGVTFLFLFCFVLNSSLTAFARPETEHVPYDEESSTSGYLSVPRVISEKESKVSDTEIADTAAKEYFGNRKGRMLVLPSSYDSRSRVNEAGIPYVMPARNQGNDGTCWAFSACSVAETSMIKQNLFQKRTLLSPLQFTWFHYNRIQNPLNLSGPDRVISSQNILQVGGNEYLSTFALANWIGLVDEELAPYESAANILSTGLSSSLCYAKNTACLQDALWIGENKFDDVKEAIMEYGSAMLPIYMNTVYYNSATYGYYCNENRYDKEEDSFSSNHMVTIVGWDDTYSRENFKTMPQRDGAWLVKNSWGENWGMNGYFWISYYDKSIYDKVDGSFVGTTVTFLDMTRPDTWDNNYGYDGGGGINWYYFVDDTTGDPIPSAIMANVYTAQYEEQLAAVSFYTIQEDIDYTVYVFCGVDTSISPTGGSVLVETVSGTLPKAGYHTIELPEEIGLTPGMKYTIAVELSSQNPEEPVKFLADGDSTWNWVKFLSQVGKGESYYREPGKNWVDVTEDPQSNWFGNFRIRAFTRLVHKEPGDVNADGDITSKDALAILKIGVGLSVESYWQMQIGDLNQDGTLNSKDSLIILRKSLGILE